MPVDQNKLNTKLAAIIAKDAIAIAAAGVRIPFLAKDYTAAQLQTWLDKATTVLNNGKTFTDTQINNAITNLYNSLSSADKAIADKILAGTPYELGGASSANAYDSLRAIVLYKFITS